MDLTEESEMSWQTCERTEWKKSTKLIYTGAWLGGCSGIAAILTGSYLNYLENHFGSDMLVGMIFLLGIILYLATLAGAIVQIIGIWQFRRAVNTIDKPKVQLLFAATLLSCVSFTEIIILPIAVMLLTIIALTRLDSSTTFLPEAKSGVFFLILAAIICFIGNFFDGIYSAVDIVIDEKPLLFTNYMLLYTTSFGLEIYGWYKIKNAVND